MECEAGSRGAETLCLTRRSRRCVSEWTFGETPFLLLMIACLCILLGFQEALVRQVHDLEELLGSEFAWVRAFFSRSFLTHRTYYITLLFLVIDFSAMSFIELELQVGVGRDDGVSAGEFNPIFYRR